MTDYLSGLRRVTITPIDENGVPKRRPMDLQATTFEAEVDFDGAEVVGGSGLVVGSAVSVEWEFDLAPSYPLLALLGYICRFCYGPLPKRHRCRRCVARP